MGRTLLYYGMVLTTCAVIVVTTLCLFMRDV